VTRPKQSWVDRARNRRLAGPRQVRRPTARKLPAEMNANATALPVPNLARLSQLSLPGGKISETHRGAVTCDASVERCNSYCGDQSPSQVREWPRLRARARRRETKKIRWPRLPCRIVDLRKELEEKVTEAGIFPVVQDHPVNNLRASDRSERNSCGGA